MLSRRLYMLLLCRFLCQDNLNVASSLDKTLVSYLLLFACISRSIYKNYLLLKVLYQCDNQVHTLRTRSSTLLASVQKLTLNRNQQVGIPEARRSGYKGFLFLLCEGLPLHGFQLIKS